MKRLAVTCSGIGPTEVIAFAAIYVLWGGTFLAIRIAVLEIPPLLTAGARFLIAGVLLYGFMLLRGHAIPTAVQWRNTLVISLLMFVATYGPLFWAMQQVSSSMTAVLEATLPITTITLEVLVFRSQPLKWRIGFGVATGFLGVMLLFLHNGAQHLPPIPCFVILTAGIAWSLGTVLSKRLSLPAAQPMNAGAQMMLGGLILLGLSLATGELRLLPHISAKAALALLYLVIFGSLIAYTSYVWLLGRFSATKVSSHAYVNPLIAVVLGHFVAAEAVTGQSISACFMITASVFLILSQPKSKEPTRLPAEHREIAA